MNDLDEEGSNSGGSIGSIGGPAPRLAGSTLDFVERTALDAQISSDTIRSVTAKFTNHSEYPVSQLGNALKLVGRLIGGGMSTRIYYVSQGGYDTHTNQPGAHERLLRDLGDSLRSFVGDLRAQGNLDRVLVMTFSEFGRRVAENANSGTDHGAAAPMFLIGGKVKAGLQGSHPGLSPAELFQGDLRFTTDFRRVYAGVLENWLGTPSEPILGRRFDALRLA
jgi:uncharacterized protein (DUF1501 family)